MGSQKRSARKARRGAFERGLGDELGDVFAREDARRAQQQKQREEALRYKACERKKRYASEAEAKDAIRSCERHGSRDLHCYRCPYCNGWHLTHK
ncbi:hypothetical protein [Parolsenella catena]|uniref:hypothetical protein n=1 Tax=Parolsenella catena TaxID=2003188 RepID=UPI0029423EE9|nr:hypothetical protein [Parolsenella catena]